MEVGGAEAGGPFTLAPTALPEPLLACTTDASAPITTDHLLLELTDPLSRATLPASTWRGFVASSYDRRSTAPGTPDWFANNDWGGMIRVEGSERVLLDVDGPGAITRIWAAGPNGKLRVYLDGATIPVVDAEASDLLEGRIPPFEAPFAFTAGEGRNLVHPITFAGHAKVTTTAPALYVNIDYRLYAANASVVTFTGTEPSDSCARRAATSMLRGNYATLGGSPQTFSLSSGTGTPVRIEAVPGGSAVTSLQLAVDRTDPDAMRRTMIVATFDGETTVQAPLGDLFAFEPDGIDVNAFPVSADHRGHFVLRSPMPFAETAVFKLVDVGAGPVQANVTAELSSIPWTERSLHFHARWTGVHEFDVFAPSLFRVATITGTGNYVGTVLHVANPHPSWWGEGDDQIWVDGEPFPSHFGSGTEDYIGYAFCSTQRFSHPLLGQTRSNSSTFGGYISTYRFHANDAIPFSRSLVFDLETLHWEKDRSHPRVSYDAVYYFYARPGAEAAGADRASADFMIPRLPEGTIKTGSGYAHCPKGELETVD